MRNSKLIIERFKTFWLPTEISIPPVIFDRFMAGEDIHALSTDYGKGLLEIEIAIRFCVLLERRNREALQLEKKWRAESWGG